MDEALPLRGLTGEGRTSLAGWLRRLAGLGIASDAPLTVEARVGLGSKKSLVLVNCRGQRVLLALSGEAISPVLELKPERRSRTASRKAMP